MKRSAVGPDCSYLFFFGRVWASALAAAAFSALLDLGLLRTFDACDATFDEVCLLFLATVELLDSAEPNCRAPSPNFTYTMWV